MSLEKVYLELTMTNEHNLINILDKWKIQKNALSF